MKEVNMPKDYGRKADAPGSPYGGPSAHGLGGHYTAPTGSGKAAGGGEYSSKRGSQGAPGGGSYSWTKTSGGKDPGGGDYTWPRPSTTGDAVGDPGMGRGPRGGGLQPDGPKMTGKGDPFNPHFNGQV